MVQFSVGLIVVPEEHIGEDSDGLVLQRIPQTFFRFSNSEMLSNLSSLLGHLPDHQKTDGESLICKFPSISKIFLLRQWPCSMTYKLPLKLPFKYKLPLNSMLSILMQLRRQQ